MKIIGTQVHIYTRDEVDRRRGRGPGRSQSDGPATREGPQTGTASRPRLKLKLPVVVTGEKCEKVPERTRAQKATPHLPNELVNEIIGHLAADMQQGDAQAAEALRGMRGMDKASHAGFGGSLQAHLLKNHLQGDRFKAEQAMTLLGRSGAKGTILGMPAGAVQQELLSLLLNKVAEGKAAWDPAILPVVQAIVKLPSEEAKAVMRACSTAAASTVGQLWPLQSMDRGASGTLKALRGRLGKRSGPVEAGTDVVRSAIASMTPGVAAKALQSAVIATSASDGQARALMGDPSMPGSILSLPAAQQLEPLRSLWARRHNASPEEQDAIRNTIRALPEGIGTELKQKAGVG